MTMETLNHAQLFSKDQRPSVWMCFTDMKLITKIKGSLKPSISNRLSMYLFSFQVCTCRNFDGN